mmetsp:Transcript_7867/g.15201  ORF Transcript_7867/g.15201 Transcript_7867/m.15201 type:complete len:489 (-) Transcript_7867:92-1558(-)
MENIDSLESRLIALSSEPPKLNSFQAYFFTINSVMGTGFLCIPWVFQNSGWLFGIIVLAFFAIQSAVLSFMLLESISRTNALAVLEDHGEPAPTTNLYQAANSFKNDAGAQAPIYTKLEGNAKLEISDRRMDLTSMVRLLFGETTSRVYLAGFCLVFFGVLISYCSVFASSFASTISILGYDTCSVYSDFGWGCRWKYTVFLAVFVLIEVLLTLASFEEQRWLQSVMACFRYMSVLIIIVTCFNAVHTNLSITGKSLLDEYPSAINLAYLAPAILISQFSYIYQPQLPCIAQSLGSNKKSLNTIVLLCSVTCFVVYCSLGLLLPAAVNNVPSLCTIVYRDYSAGYPIDERPLWSALISYIIVLFPAIDVVTTYPLLAISLSHNIFTVEYGSAKEIPASYERNIRLLCAIFPGLTAFFFFDLSQILSYTSYVALALIPMMIPLIFNASRSMVATHSHFQVNFTNSKASTALAGFQLFLIGLLFVLNITG